MKAIFKRELRSYYNTMLGYVCTAALLLFFGIYFMAYNLFAGSPYFSDTLSACLFLLMLLVPLLTMRSLAEERSSRTDQLLLTAPVTVTEVVLGKYFAMAAVFAVPVLIACLCPLIIKLNGTAYLAADYATLLAFFLLGGVYLAVGLLISALTESQLIAAVGTFAVLLLLTLWDGLLSFLPVTAIGSLWGLALLLVVLCLVLHALSDNWKVTAGTLFVGGIALLGGYLYKSEAFAGLLPKLLGKFSLMGAFDQFATQHIFDLSGLFLYLSLIALLLFLTVQVIDRRRWN
ncbi:MAG: ABC transporter permease subunit [Oscillospiraceae bacterium]